MHNPNHHSHFQQLQKPLAEQTPPPSLKAINPRSSYQEQHSNYFEKLEEQLLQKSNRYTSLIGKKLFVKQPNNQAILHFKNQSHKKLSQQNKPLKNNSFTHLSIMSKDTVKPHLHKTTLAEEETKLRTLQNPSEFVTSHSRTNLHTQLELLQSKTEILRQKTDRTQNINDNQSQQKFQQQFHLFQPDLNKTKFQKLANEKSGEITKKIDHIKEVINSFGNSKRLKTKDKQKQKTKEPSLQMHRKLVYSITNLENDSKNLENLPQNFINKSKHLKHTLTQANSNKSNKDHLISTISTKNSINHSSNESSKISFGKKQNQNSETQQFEQENLIQKNIFQSVDNEKHVQFSNPVKLIPQICSKISLKSSLKHSKSMSIKDFIILTQIGQGKVGTVYMAKHIQSNFLCALKVINRQILNQHVIIQLMREIQIQFYLDHPNIIQLYAFFSDHSHIYLMLQLCFSGNLYRHLQKHKIMTETEIRPIIKQVCYALEFMHDNNIIHRDLKPQNILFHENVVKICDLGWAVYSPLPRDTLCGTPIYASPQLVQKKKYNSKIDVWNVGVMAYELLCGRVPFQIRSQKDLYKVVLEEIHFPKCIPISQYCKNFINCCLKKQPEQRKTITELLEHSFLNENFS